MKNRFQIEESRNALFWLCLILGIIMVGMMMTAFFLSQMKIPYQITLAYPLMLAVYVAVKEVVRWTNGKQTSRLGELFVILWWGVFIAMAVGEFISGFAMPSEMLGTCIGVLIVYACSEISKKIFLLKNNKK